MSEARPAARRKSKLSSCIDEGSGQSASRAGSTLTTKAAAPRTIERRPPERLTEMDNEQFERYKEFILQQQAQFAAKIGQLEDGLARQGENVERLVGVVERVVNTVARLAEVTTERFEAVDRRADETDRKVDETDRKIAALVDSQIRTEEVMRKLGERMDSLAATVDRHIVEGHNGRARPEG
jgi:methyl-accepting chemotaxis protein